MYCWNPTPPFLPHRGGELAPSPMRWAVRRWGHPLYQAEVWPLPGGASVGQRTHASYARWGLLSVRHDLGVHLARRGR
jgi:hypothetical protein